MLLRYARSTYALLFYLHSDERREDPSWRKQYSVLAWSHVRGLIDCLYNVTLILDDPCGNGKLFRLSGLKKMIQNNDEAAHTYGQRPEWADDLKNRQESGQRVARELGVTISSVRSARYTWKTFGRFLADSYGNDNDLQRFFRKLTLGSWSDYSAIAHATFEGLIPHAAFFIEDTFPQEKRPQLTEIFPRVMTMHLTRAAVLLLCTITEVQCRCRFNGAGINERIHQMWDALLPMYEVKEFYDERYRTLMEDKGIARPANVTRLTSE